MYHGLVQCACESVIYTGMVIQDYQEGDGDTGTSSHSLYYFYVSFQKSREG